MSDARANRAPEDWLARWWLAPVTGAALAVIACLVAAGSAGFPEDDAWIHQDFARTLALTGHFAYQPGGTGAGSTSPLWVLLLAPVHLVTRGQAPLWVVVGWAALLGGAALASAGVLSGRLAALVARRAGLTPREAQVAAAITGLAVVGQWQLIWAAVSGMETDLFIVLTLALLLGAAQEARPFWLGLLAGAAVLARPEGALLALLIAAGMAGAAFTPGMAAQAGWPHARGLALGWLGRWLVPYAAGLLLCAIPYAALNLSASGRLLPSTVEAKHASVTVGALARLGAYLSQMGAVLLVVNPVLLALVVVLGGLWLAGALHARRRSRPAAPPLAPTATGFPLGTLLWLWPLALAAAYATALPGAWQYGRYLMPILPPLLALLVVRLMARLRAVKVPALPFAAALVAFAGLLATVGAAQLYSGNVRAIEGYHVAAALWLRAHTPADAVIATHDIGAIGYFSQRRVVDFAGLANPELIPLLGDQARLAAALRQRHVAYVVMRPDWFPPPGLLAHDLAPREVYRACGLGECFVVYRTGW
jgi:hypothetical protein